MEIEFNDPLFEEWTQRALLHAVYGGADFGECLTTAERITDGDRKSWYEEWIKTGDRIFAIGEESRRGGHAVSAREAYLRASNYYRTAYPFLYGAPTDQRLIEAFEKETDAFEHAAALFDPPIEPVEIPYEDTTLPGYFYRVDDSEHPRPTVIATNGYDSTIQEMHFAHAVAAIRRGYNCLTFDGPGQGRPLIKQDLFMRPDWEYVVTPVVDYACSRPEVDPDQIVLIGWSFGGYLAPRAASGEHRLAACIADPGLWDMITAIREMATKLGVAQQAADELPDIDPNSLQPLFEAVESSPELTWTFKQRGLWVHGFDSIIEYLQAMPEYSLTDRAGQIQCPTLITRAENDPLAAFADHLYDALECPKELLQFTAAEGADDHCEMTARTLFHQRTFDWLDGVVAHD
ncbi:Lysophospholipase, alpha-beta hydrolase superfamily [Haladaptatus litoreus]|uniref:Lysophospholipase, alpha-beta hydrolase superfamily n=1 Tax=Haladaptatus litoreus TaxID=553468 RepID=A0A1N7EZA5_9EURY|nr:alpha/beta hydrolase [Haladaptatus litoreus]SIR93418.1 Lysophospholipase, alpha-beta hydrolase superfamily [Haladaptatus litoreus]